MSAIVTIDFGNSYSKIGIRRAPGEDAQPATDDSLVWDEELNICIPTAAAHAKRVGRSRWFYGVDLRKLPSNAKGVEVYRNWKPAFFDEDESDLNAKQIDAIGVGYFRWLREFIQPLMEQAGVADMEDVQARITLPSFGSQTKAERRLIAVLNEAGWQSTEIAPSLPEPVANAIGVFSGGRNVLWQPDEYDDTLYPNYGKMFGGTEFFDRMGERSVDGGPNLHWVMVADLGGYTFDCAMVGFDLTTLDIPRNEKVGGKKRFATHSEPIGVSELDFRLREVLPADKVETLDGIIQEMDQQRLERFHKTIYQNQDAYIARGDVRIGEDGEMAAIQGLVQNFADQVADLAEKFIEIHQYQRVDEVILTGGGCNIPTVRQTLCDRLTRYRYANAYVPSMAEESLPYNYRRVEPVQVRAATALGGCSVFFDYEN